MVGPNNGWLKMGFRSAIVAWAAIVAMGCASSPAPTSVDSEAAVQSLGDVSVTRDGAESVIRLEGLIDPIYSVKADDDPNVVVIDLVGIAGSMLGVPESGEGNQIAVYDGVVDLVTISTFDEDGSMPLTRIEVLMSATGEPEVFSTGDGLEIRIAPSMELGAAEAELGAAEAELMGDDWATSDDWANEPGAETSLAEAEVVEAEVASMVEMTPPPVATEMQGIEVETTASGVLIGMQANGSIGALEAFTLEDPARLVIDLPGLSAGSTPARLPVESQWVTAVRTGTHESKVRIVIDGGPNAAGFEGRQVMPGTTGLWVAVGDGEDLAQSMSDRIAANEAAWVASVAPAAEEAPSEAFEAIESEPTDEEIVALVHGVSEAEEAAPLSETQAGEEMAAEEADDTSVVALSDNADLSAVYGLHYERTEDMDRTAILSDDVIAYTTSSPDPTTFVVSIPGAAISESASDRIFPKKGGPVSMVHAFQQPDVSVPEVRVVFTRAPSQEPVMSRRGSMLFVDFQDMGVAAAPPPAFPNAGVDSEAIADSSQAGVSVAMMPAEQAADSAADPVAMGDAGMNSDALAESAPAAPAAGTTELDAIGGATALPAFDSGSDLAALPGASDPGAAAWTPPPAAATPGAPAAVEVPAAIEVLEEGGLIDGKEYRGRRVSLDFKDVEIADVLRLIAEVSDLNVIAGDEVKGNVTIRLVEVPWDQALDVILMTKGLGFVRVGNVLRIAPSDVLKAEEEVRLQERRNKEKLEDLEVKLLPVNYASVKDTEGLVKRLLSARGTVNLDERTNTLIIKDISSVIDEATALIAAIDTQTPQVMIEAKIVEAALGFSRELGAVWSLQTQQFNDPFDPSSGQRRDLGSEDLRWIDQNSLQFANPITSVPTAVATVGALVLNEDFRVDAQIQAAESTGDGKVVSSPRIVTLDNKEARIEQGVSIPFQTFEGGDAKLEFIDAVLSLVVTPHITADKSIVMEIEVTRNAPDDSVATPTGSPAIAKNVAETETLVKDGQTLVLGGIYTIEKTKRQSRVPYLHRIPVIGNAFKSNEVTDARKELLVFVTPRIVQLPEMASN